MLFMEQPFLDFDLPPELIAQSPVAERDQARLLVVDRAQRRMAHHRFGDLAELLHPGDLLILNDTRVLPARLLGRRTRTGGRWEGLYLRTLADGTWEMLCQTRGRPAAGETIAVEPGPLVLRLRGRTAEGHWVVEPSSAEPAAAVLERYGHVPLPPYIRKGREDPADRGRYQTVYAQSPGAVAAPTAGLHFTSQVFARLAEREIDTAFVTLHVGLGTFRPIQAADYRQHAMHRERGTLSAETAAAHAACRARGGRVLAVGTTSVRVLETAAAGGTLRPWSGETDLFIHPPYSFRAVDLLLTNFHLPRSTLLLLTAAFAGTELLRQAYAEAIAQRYRFFSYGDAMLIV